MKDAGKLTVKLLVSGVAVAFVLRNIDFGQMWARMRSADPVFLAAALAVYALSQVISARRLGCMFAAVGLTFPALSNLKLYWLGMFYNFFLPGGIGGDGYKVYYLKKYSELRVRDLVMAILGDRMSGLVAIAIYLLFFSSFCVEQLPIPMRQWLFALAPLAVGAYYLFLRIFYRRLKAACARVTLLSMLIQGMQMLAAGLVLCSLGSMSLSATIDYLFLFLLGSIASAVPITLGGIGARELTFVVGSEWIGTSGDTAVALSLLFYATSLISALPGIYYAIRPSHIARPAVDILTDDAQTD